MPELFEIKNSEKVISESNHNGANIQEISDHLIGFILFY